nr:MAG TPA: hypothetical protein [Microviridae sp.]
MFVEIIRHYFCDKYVIGRLFIAGEYVCDTLEPALTSPHPAIPCGVYRVVLDKSRKFGRLMPFVLGVPSRSGILFHSGNTYRDTSGCILVGYNDAVGTLLNSRRCFDWLFANFQSALADSRNIDLQIKNK